MQVVELHKKKKTVINKEEMEAKVKKLRKESEKPIRGKFEFIDAQGGWLEFNYRMFPGEPIYRFRFVHGEVCDAPLGVIRHLNNTVKKIRKMNPELLEKGPIRGVPQTYEKQSRVRFTPEEYL